MLLEKGTLVVRTGNGKPTTSELGHIFKTVKKASVEDTAPYNTYSCIGKPNWRLATDKEKAYFEAHPDITNISEIPSDWNDDDIKVEDWVVSLEDRIGFRKKGDVFKIDYFTSDRNSIYYGVGAHGALNSFRKALPHEIPNLNETPFDKIQEGDEFYNTMANVCEVIEKRGVELKAKSSTGRVYWVSNSKFNEYINNQQYKLIINKKQKEDGKINTKNNDKEGLLTSNTGRQRQGNVIISVGRRQSTTGCRPVGNSQRIKCRESTVIKTKRSSNIISF